MRRHVREQGDALRSDLVEVEERLGLLEAGYAPLSRRVDLLDGRLDRAARRLGPLEPTP